MKKKKEKIPRLPRKPKCEDSCKSCGVPWSDHLGMTGTCEKLEKARKALMEIAKYTNGAGFFNKNINDFCKTTLEIIK